MIASLCSIIFVAYPAVQLFVDSLGQHKRIFQNRTFVINLQPVPYASLGRCEIRNGELDCPDVRRKGRTDLRQTQLIAIRMLRIFDLIADRHKINYWLCRGSLLGAARHHGMIPWDTDADVAMAHADYKKFLEKGLKELPSDIFFQTKATDDQFEFPKSSALTAKLRDRSSCVKSCLNDHKKCSYEDGVPLDIFALPQDDMGNFRETEPQPGWHNMFQSFLYGADTTIIYSDIFPLKKLKFEGFALSVPNQWEKHLQLWYGAYNEYMKIPPEFDRHPPGDIVPDPLHSCKDLMKKQKRMRNKTSL